MRRLLLRVVLLFIAASLAPAVGAEAPKLHLTIASVALRRGHADSELNGVLELEFATGSHDDIAIPFFDAAIKDDQAPILYIKDGKYSGTSGDFATIDYKWMDDQGVAVLSGIYPVSDTVLTIRSGRPREMALPDPSSCKTRTL